MAGGIETAVLVVGAGPVGKTLAIELGRRGTPCVLLEAEARDARRFPTTNHVASTTLECFRAWGMTDTLREAVADIPFCVVWVTGIGGYELARADWGTNARIPPLGYTPETPLWCPKPFFDPVIDRVLDAQAGVEQRYGTRLVSLTQKNDSVTAQVRDERRNRDFEIRARYLVGCDGASGEVRRQVGIDRVGLYRDEAAPPLLQTYFRSERLIDHLPIAAAQTILVHPKLPRNVLIGVDGRETYRLAILAPPDRSPESIGKLLRGYLGVDVDIQILHMWEAGQFNRAICKRYRCGRVFLAGDAAHMNTPRGGMAANTGIQDAANLGWKLSAAISGWGGDGLLASYETERRPRALALHRYQGIDLSGDEPRIIGDDQVFAAVDIDASLCDDTPDGRAARKRAGRALWDSERTHFRKPGLEFAYCYESSVCVDDGTPPPVVADWGDYTQSSRPGCRAPHAWLVDGRSTLDLFGDGFTLLRFGGAILETAVFEAAFARGGVPLRVEDVLQPEVWQLYQRRLVVVRPDGVVAWRGDAAPDAPDAVVSAIRGARGGAAISRS